MVSGFENGKCSGPRDHGSDVILLMCTPTNAVESISYSLQMFAVIMIQHLHLRTLRFERELVKGRAELDNLALKAIQEDWRVT